jgi:hypothetical protein
MPTEPPIACPRRKIFVAYKPLLQRDKNDVLRFDLKIKLACDVGTQSSLERITYSIAVERLQLFTRPGPEPDSCSAAKKAVYSITLSALSPASPALSVQAPSRS